MPRVKLSTGVTIDYFEHGASDKIPVVLLHGWTDSWRIWERSFPYFSDRLRIICPSLRGFGDSTKPHDGYAMKDFVSDCRAFVDLIGLDKFVLGGHSMGGFIAHQFAVENPDRLSHLVLIGTGTTGYKKPAFHEEAIGIENFPEPLTSEFVLRAQSDGMRLAPDASWIDTIVYESLKSPRSVWVESWIGMQQENHVDRLAEINVPTLIQCGDDDIYFPLSEQHELNKAISGSQLVLYSKAGHGLQWELPKQFATDLSKFILN
ncbi:alpha/beta fold hydrolase [Ruegeria atlantica]|uniref:alpha/beta fold hydrolase n=1 Tax=Ruegeria atlantica TaxID=81569 RepID=UPI00147BAFEB|nr:alpha/beta hydrolase [Ruegeria atlantica]